MAVHQVGRQLRQPRKLTVRPTVLDRDLPAFDIAAFAQALAECIREPPERAGRGAVEKADHRSSWVLRVSRERPRRRGAAQQRDEGAPLHSITSSARASSVGGTVRPSACAVIKFTTSSNFVGCSTGISAGFVPRRILSNNLPRARTVPCNLVHRT